MTELELGEMTPRTFSNKIKGMQSKRLESLAIERRFTTFIVNAQGAKVKPRDILPIDEIDKPQKDVEIKPKEWIDKELKKIEKQYGR
jgi:hypothetical protein